MSVAHEQTESEAIMFKEGTVVVACNDQRTIAGYLLEARPGGIMLRMITKENKLTRVWVPHSYVYEEVPGHKGLTGLLAYYLDRGNTNDSQTVREVVTNLAKKPSMELDDIVRYLPLADILPERVSEHPEETIEILVRLQPNHPEAIKRRPGTPGPDEVCFNAIKNLPPHKTKNAVERVLIESRRRSLLGIAGEWVTETDRFMRIACGPLAADDKGDDVVDYLNAFFEKSNLFGGQAGNDFAMRLALDAKCGLPWREAAICWFSEDQSGLNALEYLLTQLTEPELREVAEDCKRHRQHYAQPTPTA